MTRKSDLEERSDTFFTVFDSRRNITKPGRISGFDKLAPHEIIPFPDNQNPASTRQKYLILLGIMVVCILTTAFAFVRFQRAATAPTSTQSPTPVLPTLTPYPPTNTPTSALPPDTRPPSAPGGLAATNVSDTTVNLAWQASSDDIGVIGYTIYRNGVSIATTSDSNLTFQDLSALPDTRYAYTVDAYDQAGNRSPISAPLQVNTPIQPGNQIILHPEEDTYVNADNPGFVYGTAPSLRVDGSPDIHAYLRFFVTGLNGRKIIQARLMLYTKSGMAQGIQVRTVAGNSWSELGSDYHNAPTLGNILVSSLPANEATWITLDLTAYITGEGRFNFALTTDSATAVSLASRETGADGPQLILDLH